MVAGERGRQAGEDLRAQTTIEVVVDRIENVVHPVTQQPVLTPAQEGTQSRIDLDELPIEADHRHTGGGRFHRCPEALLTSPQGILRLMLLLDVAKPSGATQQLAVGVDQRPRLDVHPSGGSVCGPHPALEVDVVTVVHAESQVLWDVLGADELQNGPTHHLLRVPAQNVVDRR